MIYFKHRHSLRPNFSCIIEFREEGKVNNTLVTQVVEKLSRLPASLQHKVLEFVETLTIPVQHGNPGSQLLRFAGGIPLDDLQLMRLAIETACEQVDVNEW